MTHSTPSTAFVNNTLRMSGDVVTLSEADLAGLVPAAQASAVRRSRICLHANDDERTQEMVVCLLRDTWIRPHRHTGKSESYRILKGRMRLVLFDDQGWIESVIVLDATKNDSSYFCRLSSPRWHTVLVDSEYALFHETTTGPFVPGSTEFAPWSPSSPADGLQYGIHLTKLSAAWLLANSKTN